MEMAFLGQTPMQVPQATQMRLSTTANFFTGSSFQKVLNHTIGHDFLLICNVLYFMGQVKLFNANHRNRTQTWKKNLPFLRPIHYSMTLFSIILYILHFSQETLNAEVDYLAPFAMCLFKKQPKTFDVFI